MTLSKPDGGGTEDQSSFPGAVDEALAAEGGAFASSFLRLRTAIRARCDGSAAREARLVAGVMATLDFVVADPAAARAVFLGPRSARDRDEEVLGYFVELLRGAAPASGRASMRTDRAIVASVATMIRAELFDGGRSRLLELAPDIVYLVLVPHVGRGEARRWADTVQSQRYS